MIRNTLAVALLALAGLLVVLNLSILIGPADEPDGVTASGASVSPRRPEVAAVRPGVAPPPDGEAAGAAISRPLFWADRRSSPSGENPGMRPSEAAAAAGKWRLAGSISGPGGTKRALIVSDEEPNGFWLDIGAAHLGWRLVAVEPYDASVEAGGRRIRLHMFESVSPRR